MILIEDETGKILVEESYSTECLPGTDEAVAAYEVAKETVNGFWTSVNRGAKVTCCEVVANEHRFKVCVGMPDYIVAYVDYVEPREEEKPVEMQYINRRDFMPDGVTRGDGALWPTFAPIQSDGWVQIGKYPIEGRHEVGDTVLIYDRFPKPEHTMPKAGIIYNDRPEAGMARIKTDEYSAIFCAEILINFTKGDHLSDSEKFEW